MAESTPEQRLVRRVNLIMAVLSGIGVIACAWRWGLPGAIGFAAGSVISFLNFRWMARMVFAIGRTDESTGKTLKPASAMLLAMRYLLFAAIGYAIFRFSADGFVAALLGCCILIAAVISEVIYELIYGTS